MIRKTAINNVNLHTAVFTLLYFMIFNVCYAQRNIIRFNDNSGELTIYQGSKVYNITNKNDINQIRDSLKVYLKNDLGEIEHTLKLLDTSNRLQAKQMQTLLRQQKKAEDLLQDIEKITVNNSEALEDIISRAANIEASIASLNVYMQTEFGISHRNEDSIITRVGKIDVTTELILGELRDTCKKCKLYFHHKYHVPLIGINASAGFSRLFLNQNLHGFSAITYRAGIIYKYSSPTNNDWNPFAAVNYAIRHFANGLSNSDTIMEEIKLTSIEVCLGNEWHHRFTKKDNGFGYLLFAAMSINMDHEYKNYLIDYYPESNMDNINRIQFGVGGGIDYQVSLSQKNILSFGLNGVGYFTNMYKNKERVYPLSLSENSVRSFWGALEFNFTFFPVWL